MVNSKWIRRFAVWTAALLAAIAAVVVIFDPFYHFHGPLPGMKAVVTKSEYQCIGTIRNFSYDSVLAGSSTAENYNNHWFDEAFSCRTVKAIKSSGTCADLKFYMDEAFATHDLKNVFYSLDLFALDGDPETNFVNDSMPLYLYDKNPFNDVKYLFNKDVLFEDIPYLLAMNFSGYDDGMSYNFWQYKTFSEEEARKHYEQSEEIAPMQEPSEWQARVEENIGLLTDMVKNSFIHGGAQERKRRAGTENVPGIVGIGTAAKRAAANMEERTAKEREVRDYLIDRVLNEIPYCRLNGHRTDRLPNNANFSFQFVEGESLLIKLDMKGICASSGSNGSSSGRSSIVPSLRS